MKTTVLITEKAENFHMVLADEKSSEKERSLKTKPFLIKNLDERMSMPLKLRPLGFSREFGLNE